jgi:hypothetical protein
MPDEWAVQAARKRHPSHRRRTTVEDDYIRVYNSGGYNVASGYQAQQSLTTGGGNVASGYQAQQSLTTGGSNVASGSQAQQSLTTGGGNVASGYQAQQSLTTGGYNVASGYHAQRAFGSNVVPTGGGTFTLPPADAGWAYWITGTGVTINGKAIASGSVYIASGGDTVIAPAGTSVARSRCKPDINNTTALGTAAFTDHDYGIAIGAEAEATTPGEVQISTAGRNSKLRVGAERLISVNEVKALAAALNPADPAASITALKAALTALTN